MMSHEFCKSCENSDLRETKDKLNMYMLLVQEVVRELLKKELPIEECYNELKRHIQEHKRKEALKRWHERLNTKPKERRY